MKTVNDLIGVQPDMTGLTTAAYKVAVMNMALDAVLENMKGYKPDCDAVFISQMVKNMMEKKNV